MLSFKNGVFWDVTPCGSCKNRRFRGTYLHLLQGEKKLADSCHPDDKAICSSEMSVLTKTTRLYIPEDGNLHNYRRENLKSYKLLCFSYDFLNITFRYF
jgi:hypothetical protein